MFRVIVGLNKRGGRQFSQLVFYVHKFVAIDALFQRNYSSSDSIIRSNYHSGSYQRSEFFGTSYPISNSQVASDGIFEIVLHGTPDELKDILLDASFDPNIRGENNRTPLMVAAERNRLDMIAVLLNHKADLNLQDDFGDTAVNFAAREGCKQAVNMLVDAGAQVDVKNNEEQTAAEITLDHDIDVKIREAQEPRSVVDKHL